MTRTNHKTSSSRPSLSFPQYKVTFTPPGIHLKKAASQILAMGKILDFSQNSINVALSLTK